MGVFHFHPVLWLVFLMKQSMPENHGIVLVHEEKFDNQLDFVL
jgi:hypothetical protein